MGIFNFLKGRRERESAIPGGVAAGEETGLVAPAIGTTEVVADPGATTAQAASASTTEVTGMEGLGALGQILGQALKGHPTVMVSNEAQVMNLQNQGNELRNSILETLQEHGIDAEKGQAVQINDPAVAQEIMSKLSALGVDPAQMTGNAAAFGAMGAGGAAFGANPAIEGGDQLGQLERLGKLHEQGILTDAELAEQKRKILGE